MLDKVLPALIIAAISGLTFIAYKHPTGYRKMFLGLTAGFLAVNTCILAWNASIYFAFDAVIPFFDTNKIVEGKAALKNLEVPVWIIGSGILAQIYMMLLTWLPNLLGDDKPVDK